VDAVFEIKEILGDIGKFLEENEEWLIRLKQLEQSSPDWYDDEDNQGFIQFLEASELLIKLITALAMVEQENPRESDKTAIEQILNSDDESG
jgi:hypothetical protein